MNRQLLLGLVCAGLMGSTAVLTKVITPTTWLSEKSNRGTLEAAVPEAFGDWRLDRAGIAAVVDPQSQAVLNRIYSQILSRSYVNSKGERVMLSIAYGEDQRDSMQLHYPEVCYPAQGFSVESNRSGSLSTQFGELTVRKLVTNLGGRRPEPVSYWTTIGDHLVLGGMDKKFTEMRYGFAGYIPDGLLFRVSTIDPNSERAFKVHAAFVNDLISASTPTARLWLAGIPKSASPSP
jgi:EpsI family protein